MLVIAMVLALCLPSRKTAEFTPPPFEQNAVSGTPEAAQELGYSSPYKEGIGNCLVSFYMVEKGFLPKYKRVHTLLSNQSRVVGN